MENVDIEKIVAVISDTVSRGEVFRLNPTGISMLPTIVSGDDSVLLARAEDLKKYDIVLYRRRTGKIVLHRIIGFSKGKCVMCGDNQNSLERIEKSDIIAKTSGIFKGAAHRVCRTGFWLRVSGIKRWNCLKTTPTVAQSV